MFVWTLLGLRGLAQTPTYEMYVTNQSQIDSKTYQFDVYLLRTGSTALELSGIQFGLGIDTSITNGGTLSFTMVSGSSQLVSASVPTSFSVGATYQTVNSVVYRYLNQAARSGPGAGSGTVISATKNGCSSPGTRIGTYRLTNTVDFRQASTCKHVFSTSVAGGRTNTLVSAYIGTTSTNITSTANHFAYNSTGTCDQNPSLNGCAVVASITDNSGVTCFGGSNGSVTVSLSGTGTSSTGTYSVDGGTAVSYSSNPFTVSGLSAGSHSISITSGLCSASTGSFTTSGPSSALSSSFDASGCDSYTLPWGATVTSSGAYTHVYTSAAGCDSTVTANITITASTSNVTPASACDSYTWSVNGQTYTASGSYSSVSGCHTEVLNLTITASTSNTTPASACDSYVWSVNGQTYTQSGSYTSVSGCATEILNLTVNSSTSSSSDATACDSYTLPWGTTVTESGVYSNVYSTVNGCDSTVTVNVTINYSSNTSEPVTICSTQAPYEWNGNSYSTSGTYSYDYTNASGCPSVAVLVLTVNSTSSSSESRAVCANQVPYTWNGVIFTAAGTQTATLTNAAGCDSVVTMTLTVSGGIPTAVTAVTQTLVANNCGARVYRYTAALTANAAGYAWTLPTGVGGVAGVTVDSGDITSSRVIRVMYASNNAAAASGDSIKVRAFSGCGTAATKGFKLTNTAWAPLAAPTITATNMVTNVCNSRKVRYSVAVPAATAGAVGFEWSFVGDVLGANASIDSGTSESRVIVVSYTSNAGAAANDSVRVRYNFNNGCSYGTQVRAKIGLAALNAPVAPTITATNMVTNVCGGRKVRFTAPVLPAATATAGAATGYEWSFVGTGLGANATIDSGDANSRVIVVLFTSNAAAVSTDSVRCRYSSDCGYGVNGRFKIALAALNAPIAPTITATNVVTNVCGGRKVRFTAPVLPVATATAGAATGYEWSFVGTGLGANATIDSGDVNSRVIVVLFTSNAAAVSTDSVRCRYSSGCGYGVNGKFKIALAALGAPLAPSLITVTSVAPSVCGAKLYRYTAPVLPVATATAGAATEYLWSFTGTLGANAVIDSGSETSRVILVRYTSNAAAGAGDSVRVRYNSGCGYGPNKAAKLTNVVTTAPIAPTAVTITSVSPTACGARVYRYSAPALPAATATAAGATGYEWAFTGTLGANATIDSGDVNSRTILVRYTLNSAAGAGDSVKVRYSSSCGYSPYKAAKLSNTALAGCPPPVAKVAAPASFGVNVYPNPSNGQFNVQLTGATSEAVNVRVLDAQGRYIKAVRSAGNGVITLGSDLKAGAYLLEVRQGNNVKVTRVLKF